MYWKPNPDLYKPYLRSRILRGLGLGTYESYLSWLRLHDFASRGTTFRIRAINMRRVVLLFSENEAINFFLNERNPNIVDFRENYPIFDIDWSVEVSKARGIRHGYRDGYPFPFTLDAVVTERIGKERFDRAQSVKIPDDALNPEIRKRLAIERDWCQDRAHIPWALVDTRAFEDKIILSTLKTMRAWFLNFYEPDGKRESRFETIFSSGYARNVPLREQIQRAARTMRVSQDLAIDMFRFCAWHDRIPVKLTHRLAMNSPLILR